MAGADGSSMVAVGSAILYLSVSGLPALAPIHARITLCENMDPNFVVGKVLQDAWNWSIRIQDRKEYLEADREANRERERQRETCPPPNCFIIF